MFLAILFVTFIQISLFGAAAAEEENLPWAAQQHIQTRAIAYNNHCKSETMINLRDDLDLWSLLVYNKICGKRENSQSLAWVLSEKDKISAEIDTLTSDLGDYRTNIELFNGISDYNENASDFAIWLSTTAQSGQGIEAVRTWTIGLERRQKKLQQLHVRLGGFYDTESADVMPSKNAIIAFVLAEPGDVLGALLVASPVETILKVGKLITDVFSIEDENPDEADE